MHRRAAILGLFVGTLLMMSVAARGHVLAQDGGRAAVVVRFDDERTVSKCIAFDETEISGYSLLQRSGLALDVKSGGQGGLVCAIDGTGCGVNNCLCQCQGDPCVYWSYWHMGDEGWSYSAIGSTVRRLSDGDVDGWSWGPGSIASAIEPPAMSFEEICSDQADAFAGVASEAADQSVDWLLYGAVGLLVVVVGAGALVASRRSKP